MFTYFLSISLINYKDNIFNFKKYKIIKKNLCLYKYLYFKRNPINQLKFDAMKIKIQN